MRLYEISSEVEQAVALLGDYIDERGEITDEAGLTNITTFIDAMKGDLSAKVLDIACVIKSARAEIEARKDEIAKQQKSIRGLDSKIEWLKDYVKNNAEGQKFKDSRASVHWTSSQSVHVGLDTLDHRYLRVWSEPNKVEIKKALKAGEEVPGCELVDKTSMVVR